MKRTKTIIADLKVGECFKVKDTLYIMTDKSFTEEEAIHPYRLATNLNTGELYLFTMNVKVTVVLAKVVIAV